MKLVEEDRNLDMADTTAAFDERTSTEDRGVAVPAASSHTEHPERLLEPGNPNLAGAGQPATARTPGMMDKVKGLFEDAKKGYNQKTGSGAGHSPDPSPYGTAADTQGYGGHSLDPTAAPVGDNFKQQPAVKSPRAKSPGPWPHPTDPRVGHTNAQGGATLADEHGNLHPGPRDDGVKKEGFMSKIMDKLHTPRSPKTTPTSNQ